jgi:hypothetical protein
MARSKVLDITDQSIPKKYVETKSQTLSGSNTTVVTPLFRITGTVQVTKLYAVVTTVLGSNVTAAYWRTNDQTAAIAISLASGTSLSSFSVGSLLLRQGTYASALKGKNASAGAFEEANSAGTSLFTPFLVVQKTGSVNTDIEFVYTTTNTPTSGVIQHFVEFEPLTPDSDLVAV